MKILILLIMEEYNSAFEPDKVRDKVRDKLRSNILSISDKDLLIHVLNVAFQHRPCAYFGRFYNDESEKNALERCLVLETSSHKDNPCPFYDRSVIGCCNYPYNATPES